MALHVSVCMVQEEPYISITLGIQLLVQKYKVLLGMTLMFKIQELGTMWDIIRHLKLES